MPAGALSIRTFPHEMVRLACRKCDRKGQYRRHTLIQKHGAEVAMPDLLGKIAVGCPRLKPFGNDRCGAYYTDLAQSAVASGGADV